MTSSPSSVPRYSADGQRWWDGEAWVDVALPEPVGVPARTEAQAVPVATPVPRRRWWSAARR